MRSISLNLHGVKSVTVSKPVEFTYLPGSYTTLTIIDGTGQQSTINVMSDDDEKPVDIILEEK